MLSLLLALACAEPTCDSGMKFTLDGLCVADTGVVPTPDADADTDADADADTDSDTDTDTDTGTTRSGLRGEEDQVGLVALSRELGWKLMERIGLR